MINYLYINEHGQPIERTPQSHPYNYDGLFYGAAKEKQHKQLIQTGSGNRIIKEQTS